MLTLTDPLATEEVIIAITVLPADVPRTSRAILLTLGVAGKAPVIRTGTYADLHLLLDAAWHLFEAPQAFETPSPTQGLLDLF